MLGYCEKCKEESVKVKVYIRRDGVKCRVEYCLNKICGYKKELPFINHWLGKPEVIGRCGLCRKPNS